MKNLRGRTVLITGAASGIGRASAIAFAREGASLITCDLDEDGLRSLTKELVDAGGESLYHARVDVSKRDEMQHFANTVHGIVSAVDVLINNAGVALQGSFLQSSLDDLSWVLGVNLWGVVHGCHYFLPAMVQRGQGGHVVNVSSALGYVGAPGVAGYSMSKFAVLGLTEALRGELAPHRIGVSAICPGIIDTGIIGKGRMRGADNVDALRGRLQKLYSGRGYTPDRVADAIVAAVKHNKPIVPVSPEAWLLYFAKRWTPGLLDRTSGLVLDRILHP